MKKHNPDYLFEKRKLKKEEWFTPNSYSNDYGNPPKASGVYLLIHCDFDYMHPEKEQKNKILYIGSSKNLSKRYKGHDVLRKLEDKFGYIRFYFKETPNFTQEEKRLIRLIKPEFNIMQYRDIWL